MEKNAISKISDTAQSLLHCQMIPPKRILVVDDDCDIRHLNSKVLTLSGYHVDVVEDGAFAWSTLKRNKHDLLITDNRMPKVSGVDLLRKLHAARMVLLPVIMATEVSPKDEFVRYPWLRPAAMLLKPYTIDALLGTVKEVLALLASDGHANLASSGALKSGYLQK